MNKSKDEVADNRSERL